MLQSIGVRAVAPPDWAADPTSGTWVSADGRFRIGPLTGGWSKPVAQYIGRGAREAARRARLAQLRTEAAQVGIEQDRIAAALAELARRRVMLDAEIERRPPDTELRDAYAAVVGVAAEQVRLGAERAAAADLVVAAGDEAQAATDALHTGAADVDLPADRAGLATVREQLGAYREALAGLWPSVDAFALARAADAEAAADLDTARLVLVTATERAGEADRAARTSAQEYETLRATVGAAVEELQAQLAAVAEQITATEKEQKAVRARHTDRGRADGLREAATATLATAARSAPRRPSRCAVRRHRTAGRSTA